MVSRHLDAAFALHAVRRYGESKPDPAEAFRNPANDPLDHSPAFYATLALGRWFDKERDKVTPMPGPVITVSGPHGTGKSTYAKALAEALHLRYVSAGELFRGLAREQKLSLEALSTRAAKDPSIDRMLDERTKSEAQKGGVVIDAQLAAWIAGELADAKVLLTAPNDVRFKRIAERDHVGVDEARKETEYRESIQQERYKKYYGIDVSDLSIYDLKIDTSLYPIEATKRIIIDSVHNFLVERAKLAQRS